MQTKKSPFSPLDTSHCSDDQKKEILTYAADTRKFEIERFWSRSLVFWGFISAALIAFGAAKGHERLQFLAACYGLICSLAWALQNRGSKYWHESWERKVETVENDVLKTNLFSNKEPIKNPKLWLAARRYSSSKLVIALSDATCAVWVALIFVAARINADAQADLTKLAMLCVTGWFAWLLLIGARSK